MGWDEDNADRISASNDVLFSTAPGSFLVRLPNYSLLWVRCPRCGKRFFGTKLNAKRLTTYLEHVRDTCPWYHEA